MANELISALVPPRLIPELVARGFFHSAGDDGWRSVVDHPDYGPLVGAYAIPAAWRTPYSPDQRSPLRIDAVILASAKGRDPINAQWLSDDLHVIPNWIMADAYAAAKSPRPGVDPGVEQMERIRRPFPDGGPDLAYRMGQLAGATDALRDQTEQ